MSRVDPVGPVERARALVGVRFRPQGRSTRLGLDCAGLAALAFDLPIQKLPSDYPLRGNATGTVEKGLAAYFEAVPVADARVGDLLLVRPGPTQLHLLLLTPTGYIHADAGQRRVVEVPGAVGWPVVSAWRDLSTSCATGEI